MTDIAIWENEKKVLTMAKEFIERGALIARYDAEHVGPPGRARELMVTAPAADVIEVRHERWEKHGSKWQCTGCKVLMNIKVTSKIDYVNAVTMAFVCEEGFEDVELDEVITEGVTHWMPLPEPPKEEK